MLPVLIHIFIATQLKILDIYFFLQNKMNIAFQLSEGLQREA